MEIGIGGNVVESESMGEATPERIAKWVEMGWVEVVE